MTLTRRRTLTLLGGGTILAAGRDLRAKVIEDLAPDMALLLADFGTDRLRAIRPVLTDLRRFLDENRERG